MEFKIGYQGGFIVEHCYSCAVRGYLIVSPVIEVDSLDALPLARSEEIGPVLVNAVAMVKALIKPVRIYCAQFGEEETRLHFHVFPRSEALTAEYLAAFPEHSSQLRGPIVLDWARDRYRCTPEEAVEAVSSTIEGMRQWWSAQQSASADRSTATRFRVG